MKIDRNTTYSYAVRAYYLCSQEMKIGLNTTWGYEVTYRVYNICVQKWGR